MLTKPGTITVPPDGPIEFRGFEFSELCHTDNVEIAAFEYLEKRVQMAFAKLRLSILEKRNVN